MGYQLITAPSVEPLLLADVKSHLRVEIADDDALIGLMITAVRQYAEQLTARSLITQQWRMVMDCFPWPVELEKGPVQSIDSITYLDMSGATQTMPTSDYVYDLSGTLARITPCFGKVWPIALPQIGAVKIAFTAGYGAAGTNVPEGLKSWMKLRIGALYENREEVVSGRSITMAPLPFADRLLDPYTIVRA